MRVVPTPELEILPPRPIRCRRGSGSFWRWGHIPLFFGVLFWLLIAAFKADQVRVLLTGRTVAATVVAREVEKHSKGDTFILHYRIGSGSRRVVNVGQTEFNALPVGATFPAKVGSRDRFNEFPVPAAHFRYNFSSRQFPARGKSSIMSKMKTHKATAKRVTTTGTGKLKRRKVGLAHLQTKRASTTQMRNNDAAMSVAKSNDKSIRRLLAI